jgi:hypothetical protein
LDQSRLKKRLNNSPPHADTSLVTQRGDFSMEPITDENAEQPSAQEILNLTYGASPEELHALRGATEKAQEDALQAAKDKAEALLERDRCNQVISERHPIVGPPADEIKHLYSEIGKLSAYLLTQTQVQGIFDGAVNHAIRELGRLKAELAIASSDRDTAQTKWEALAAQVKQQQTKI